MYPSNVSLAHPFAIVTLKSPHAITGLTPLSDPFRDHKGKYHFPVAEFKRCLPASHVHLAYMVIVSNKRPCLYLGFSVYYYPFGNPDSSGFTCQKLYKLPVPFVYCRKEISRFKKTVKIGCTIKKFFYFISLVCAYENVSGKQTVFMDRILSLGSSFFISVCTPNV